MASIFSYEPDPPRISSPWLTGDDESGHATPVSQKSTADALPLNVDGIRDFDGDAAKTGLVGLLSDHTSLTKLIPEPQDGPIEYKLHLLMRPRRKYMSFSTGTDTAAPTDSPPTPTSAYRQQRFSQLTTQLLWRLQQSAPYHSSTRSDLVLPQFPETPSTDEAPRVGKLLSGLEDSRGALYEIGVSDNGVLVGLTADELNESILNLKAMAASLSCTVKVERMFVVGECEWREDAAAENGHTHPIPAKEVKRAKLWVAEVLVTPDLSFAKGRDGHPAMSRLVATTEQLRAALTGPTTSGKSSLLGTVTTSVLDNARGRSRMSLLKHLHELESGVTSSVTHELIGYNTRGNATEVVNYATDDVTTWTDIHAQAESGRLVFLSDSAGHSKYRRTTVRGLVGWAPHWTLLCIAADGGSDESASAVAAHLDLCLKLEKPLVIMVTKMDVASKAHLKATLGKVLTVLKRDGRTPAMLPHDQASNLQDGDLTAIPESDMNAVQKLVDTMDTNNLNKVVPIVMTSAVKGNGIRMLHALLSKLPLPAPSTAGDAEQPACLFHIEDVFMLPASVSLQTSHANTQLDSGTVVAGYLRYGSLSIDDRIVVGPLPADTDSGSDEDFVPSSTSPSPPVKGFIGGRSLSKRSDAELNRLAVKNAARGSAPAGEWRFARVVSLRNLRLPVHRLEAGQVGTVGLVWEAASGEDGNLSTDGHEKATRLRKGMVLAAPNGIMLKTGLHLQAASRFAASFDDGDVNSVAPSSHVVVYIASIRASARVISLTPQASTSTEGHSDDTDGFFGAADKDSGSEAGVGGSTEVTLEFLTTREYIERGSQVLMMPGGRGNLTMGSERREMVVGGLEGFVGKVVDTSC